MRYVRAAFLSVPIFCLSLHLHPLAIEIRSYWLSLFLLSGSMFLLQCYGTTLRRRYALGAVVLAACSLLTAYGSIFLIPVLMWVTLLQLRARKAGWREFVFFTGIQAIWGMATVLIYLNLVSKDLNVVESDYLLDFLYTAKSNTPRVLFFFEKVLESLSGLFWGSASYKGGGLVMFAICLLGVGMRPTHSGKQIDWSWIALLTLPLFGVNLASALGLFPGGNIRHVSFLTLPYYMALAIAVEKVLIAQCALKIEQLRPWHRNVGLAVLLTLIGTTQYWQFYVPRLVTKLGSESMLGISDDIDNAIAVGRPVLVSRGLANTLNYYMRPAPDLGGRCEPIQVWRSDRFHFDPLQLCRDIFALLPLVEEEPTITVGFAYLLEPIGMEDWLWLAPRGFIEQGFIVSRSKHGFGHVVEMSTKPKDVQTLKLWCRGFDSKFEPNQGFSNPPLYSFVDPPPWCR
jgi:hypothetical protein